MEALINITTVGHKSKWLHSISSSLILNPIVILMALAFLFLPMESSSIKGYFYEPALDIREHWILIPVFLGLMALGHLLAKYNRLILYGKFIINEEYVELRLVESTERFETKNLKYIELTRTEELYFRTKLKRSFKLEIEKFQELDTLRSILNSLSSKTEVVIR